MLPSAPGGTSDGLTGQKSVECARHTPVSPGQRDDQDDGDDVRRLKRDENWIEHFEGVRRDEKTRDEPDLPGDEADTGRATFSDQMADLRQVSNRDGDRPEKTQNLRNLLHRFRVL